MDLTLRHGERDYKVRTTPDGTLVDGERVEPSSRAVAVADGDRRLVFLDGEVYELEVVHQGRRRAAAHQSSLSAPMPASVIRVNVQVGDAVKKGDTLVVLEAMKMELPVRAPADGIVRAVACTQGQLVQPGVPLIQLDDA